MQSFTAACLVFNRKPIRNKENVFPLFLIQVFIALKSSGLNLKWCHDGLSAGEFLVRKSTGSNWDWRLSLSYDLCSKSLPQVSSCPSGTWTDLQILRPFLTPALSCILGNHSLLLPFLRIRFRMNMRDPAARPPSFRTFPLIPARLVPQLRMSSRSGWMQQSSRRPAGSN